jgi:hypothetical protein
MRAATLYVLVVCLVGCVVPLAAFAGGPSCGCEQPSCGVCNPPAARSCTPLCLHRHRCCCTQGTREAPRESPRFAPRAAQVPTGPIVESYPMMRAMPAMMAMPMMPVMYGQAVMPTARAAAYEEERPRSRAPERSCAGSADRIDELDARVEALNLRMKTVQRAVEIQTAILEELKTNGTIGKQKLGASPKIPD